MRIIDSIKTWLESRPANLTKSPKEKDIPPLPTDRDVKPVKSTEGLKKEGTEKGMGSFFRSAWFTKAISRFKKSTPSVSDDFAIKTGQSLEPENKSSKLEIFNATFKSLENTEISHTEKWHIADAVSSFVSGSDLKDQFSNKYLAQLKAEFKEPRNADEMIAFLTKPLQIATPEKSREWVAPNAHLKPSDILHEQSKLIIGARSETITPKIQTEEEKLLETVRASVQQKLDDEDEINEVTFAVFHFLKGDEALKLMPEGSQKPEHNDMLKYLRSRGFTRTVSPEIILNMIGGLILMRKNPPVEVPKNIAEEIRTDLHDRHGAELDQMKLLDAVRLTDNYLAIAQAVIDYQNELQRPDGFPDEKPSLSNLKVVNQKEMYDRFVGELKLWFPKVEGMSYSQKEMVDFLFDRYKNTLNPLTEPVREAPPTFSQIYGKVLDKGIDSKNAEVLASAVLNAIAGNYKRRDTDDPRTKEVGVTYNLFMQALEKHFSQLSFNERNVDAMVDFLIKNLTTLSKISLPIPLSTFSFDKPVNELRYFEINDPIKNEIAKLLGPTRAETDFALDMSHVAARFLIGDIEMEKKGTFYGKEVVEKPENLELLRGLEEQFPNKESRNPADVINYLINKRWAIGLS